LRAVISFRKGHVTKSKRFLVSLFGLMAPKHPRVRHNQNKQPKDRNTASERMQFRTTNEHGQHIRPGN